MNEIESGKAQVDSRVGSSVLRFVECTKVSGGLIRDVRLRSLGASCIEEFGSSGRVFPEHASCDRCDH